MMTDNKAVRWDSRSYAVHSHPGTRPSLLLPGARAELSLLCLDKLLCFKPGSAACQACVDPGWVWAGYTYTAVTHVQIACSAFVELMADLQAFSMTHTPAQLLDFTLQRSDYAVQVKVRPKIFRCVVHQCCSGQGRRPTDGNEAIQGSMCRKCCSEASCCSPWCVAALGECRRLAMTCWRSRETSFDLAQEPGLCRCSNMKKQPGCHAEIRG